MAMLVSDATNFLKKEESHPPVLDITPKIVAFQVNHHCCATESDYSSR